MDERRHRTVTYVHDVRVRYGECDQQGVVYNARYGDYVDLACTEFLNAALGRTSVAGGGFEFQVVKLLIEWSAPARYDDALEISVALKKLGATSFTTQSLIAISPRTRVFRTYAIDRNF